MRRPIDTVIDPDLCTGCGECVRVCPADALELENGRAVVTGDTSLGCGHCVAVCPADAVAVRSLEIDPFELSTLPGCGGHVAPGAADAAGLVRLMRSRRSCRNFLERVVPREVLADLVRIGTTAPSGTNSQRWAFTVFPDRAAVLRLAVEVKGFYERLNRRAESPLLRLLARLFAGDVLGRYYRDYHDTVADGLREFEATGRDRLFHGAPAVILVGSEPGASCPAEDALLATQNVLLAAHAVGLGSCLVGFAVEAFRHDRAVQLAVGIPDEEQVHAAIALGYPDEIYLRPAGRRRVEPRWVEAE